MKSLLKRRKAYFRMEIRASFFERLKMKSI